MNATLHIHHTVNIAESIRRNQPATNQTARIPLLSVVSLLTDPERQFLARCIRLSDTTYINQIAQPRYLSIHGLSHQMFPIGSPTESAEGIVEVIRDLLSREAVVDAKAAAEKKQKEEVQAAAYARVAVLVAANPSLMVRTEDGYPGMGVEDEVSKIYVYSYNLPEDIRILVETEGARVKAAATQRKEAEKVAQQAAEAARLERLLVHLDANEQEMHRRGHLDLDIITSRLDQLAMKDLRAQIEPPAVEATLGHQAHRAGLMNKAAFQRLKVIERRLGRECIPFSNGLVGTTTTTADGREIKVSLKLAA
jgi:hypothetical protein